MKNLKTAEKGRSLVEMLAVLAIIGILSVGGIAGYDLVRERNQGNEILSTASAISVLARTKGINTDSRRERLSLPDGISYMTAAPDGTVTVRIGALPPKVYKAFRDSLEAMNVTVEENLSGEEAQYGEVKFKLTK